MFSWEQRFRGIARQARDGGLYRLTPDSCRCLVLMGWLGSWTGQTTFTCTKVLCTTNTSPPPPSTTTPTTSDQASWVESSESLAPLALPFFSINHDHYLISSYGDDVRPSKAMMTSDNPVKIRSGLDVSGDGWRVQSGHRSGSHTQRRCWRGGGEGAVGGLAMQWQAYRLLEEKSWSLRVNSIQ